MLLLFDELLLLPKLLLGNVELVLNLFTSVFLGGNVAEKCVGLREDDDKARHDQEDDEGLHMDVLFLDVRWSAWLGPRLQSGRTGTDVEPARGMRALPADKDERSERQRREGGTPTRSGLNGGRRDLVNGNQCAARYS